MSTGNLADPERQGGEFSSKESLPKLNLQLGSHLRLSHMANIGMRDNLVYRLSLPLTFKVSEKGETDSVGKRMHPSADVILSVVGK